MLWKLAVCGAYHASFNIRFWYVLHFGYTTGQGKWSFSDCTCNHTTLLAFFPKFDGTSLTVPSTVNIFAKEFHICASRQCASRNGVNTKGSTKWYYIFACITQSCLKHAPELEFPEIVLKTCAVKISTSAMLVVYASPT